MPERGVKQQGVALLMTLSIIMILSIALMKTFENRSVETAHLANSLQRFQAETLSRSIFRAVLISIKTKQLLFVIKNTDSWKGVPIPIRNNQYFQINKIEPLDHLFNLNRRFRPDDPWPRVFLNMINGFRDENDPLNIPLEIEDINPVLSAINDWIDWDSEPDDQFGYSYEEYQEMTPEFLVKNRGLDRLSEAKLIPPFKELGLTHDEIRSNFRVFLIDKSSEKQFIDVNLATEDEMIAFLEFFKDVDVDKFPNLYDKRAEIAALLTTRDEELGYDELTAGVFEPKPRFPHPIEKTNSRWRKRLNDENITLNGDEHELFSGRTKHLLISYSLAVGDVIVTTEAIVEIIYASEKDTRINGFNVLSYEIR